MLFRAGMAFAVEAVESEIPPRISRATIKNILFISDSCN
jgi:hypothetical protein